MRLAALLLLPLLAGCLDFERIVLTVDARKGARTVVSELRSEGLHHSGVKGCGDVAGCLAALRLVVCKDVQDDAAHPDDFARVELREDGTVDVVATSRRTWDEVEALSAKEGGLLGVWTARAGKDEVRRPTWAFTYEDGALDTTVLRGRFEHLRYQLDRDEGMDTWMLRSARGTLRVTADIAATKDDPTPEAELRWAAKVPGLAEALRTTPVTCTGAEAAAADHG